MSMQATQKEYEILRSWVVEGYREIWALERYTLVAVAGFWAWFLSQSEWYLWMDYARYLPAVLVAFAGFRCWTFVGIRRRMSNYFLEIEGRLGLGWERFLVKEKSLNLALPAAVFWILLFGTCLFVGVAASSDWIGTGPAE